MKNRLLIILLLSAVIFSSAQESDTLTVMKEEIVVAKELLNSFIKDCEINNFKEIKQFKGKWCII